MNSTATIQYAVERFPARCYSDAVAACTRAIEQQSAESRRGGSRPAPPWPGGDQLPQETSARLLTLLALCVLAVAACTPKEGTTTPTRVAADAVVDSTVHRIDIGTTGYHYLVDPAIEACYFVAPGAGPAGIDCRRLKDTFEVAAPFLAFVTEAPRPANPEPLAKAPPPNVSKLHFDGITRISDTEFEIERKIFDHFIANPRELARSARFVPSSKDGKADGFKVFAIRAGSLFAALGLRNGDTVHRINDHELYTPDGALEAYSQVRQASELRVELSRQSTPLTLLWRIVD